VHYTVNAGVLDTLSMQKLFSAEELAESGLAARVLEAQERAISAIESATRALAEFAVPRCSIEQLVDLTVEAHARELKKVLTAASGS
jgi:enoyl-CoA hydratase/carnithine racemase